MEWIVYIVMLLVSVVIAVSMRPKIEKPKAPGLEDIDWPQFEEGTPQSVLFGDCWTESWMVLGLGNFRTSEIKKRQKTSPWSSKMVTVGYRFFIGMHMGLNRDACDAITHVKVGDRLAWSGNVTGNLQVLINAPNLFGGDEQEGGVVGALHVMMGGPAQVAPLALSMMLGGLVPGFRRKTTLFFGGQYSAMTQYPKVWAVRRNRTLAGWDGDVWNAAQARIVLPGPINAANGAHIIWQAYTNRAWGRGLPVSRMHTESFSAAAATLYAEEFGLCLEWKRSDTVDSFVRSVCDHIGAVVFEDPTDGRVGLRLIRADYDPDTLPVFTLSTGLLSIDDDDNGSTSSATNEVIVKYKDVHADEVRSVRVKNLASIRAHGRMTTTKNYPGIPTADLALRIAQRDLNESSGFIKRFRLRMDRRASLIEMGRCFRIAVPERGITNMILRAGRIEEADWGDGTITITALQDVFGLPSTSFGGSQPISWTPPDRLPVPITIRRVIEVPYWELARSWDPANLAALPATAAYIMCLGARPTSMSIRYDVATRVGSSGSFVSRSEGSFTPTAVLAGALNRIDGSAAIVDGVDLGSVAVGTIALVDDEWLRVDGINIDTGIITFGRGCLDSTPETHAAAARVWFCGGDYDGEDPTQYNTGNTVQARMLTVSPGGTLPVGSASTDSIVLTQRQAAPYPPARLRINGLVYPAAVTGSLTVGWSHRDRVGQGVSVMDTSAASIGPESGVTYTVEVRDELSVVRHTTTGITGNAHAIDALELSGAASLTIAVWAVRDGFSSARHSVTCGYS